MLEGGEVVLATVRDGGRVIARGRGSVHGDWLGVSSLWTEPARRGTGLGTAVLADLLGWGAERGATTAYLQVVAANAAAQRLYEACGFEEHHRYAYYARGEPDASAAVPVPGRQRAAPHLVAGDVVGVEGLGADHRR